MQFLNRKHRTLSLYIPWRREQPKDHELKKLKRLAKMATTNLGEKLFREKSSALQTP